MTINPTHLYEEASGSNWEENQLSKLQIVELVICYEAIVTEHLCQGLLQIDKFDCIHAKLRPLEIRQTYTRLSDNYNLLPYKRRTK